MAGTANSTWLNFPACLSICTPSTPFPPLYTSHKTSDQNYDPRRVPRPYNSRIPSAGDWPRGNDWQTQPWRGNNPNDPHWRSRQFAWQPNYGTPSENSLDDPPVWRNSAANNNNTNWWDTVNNNHTNWDANDNDNNANWWNRPINNNANANCWSTCDTPRRYDDWNRPNSDNAARPTNNNVTFAPGVQPVRPTRNVPPAANTTTGRPRGWGSDFRASNTPRFEEINPARYDLIDQVRLPAPIAVNLLHRPPIPAEHMSLTQWHTLVTTPSLRNLRIIHPYLPWTIDVSASDHHSGITYLDLVYQICTSLDEITSTHDYECEEFSPRERREIANAYRWRRQQDCHGPAGIRTQDGMRKIDYLRGHLTLEGFHRVNPTTWEMVTRKAEVDLDTTPPPLPQQETGSIWRWPWSRRNRS